MLISLKNVYLGRYYAPNYIIPSNLSTRVHGVISLKVLRLAYYYALNYDFYKMTERPAVHPLQLSKLNVIERT